MYAKITRDFRRNREIANLDAFNPVFKTTVHESVFFAVIISIPSN